MSIEVLEKELDQLKEQRMFVSRKISEKQLEIIKAKTPFVEGQKIKRGDEFGIFAGFEKSWYGWETRYFKIKKDGTPYKNTTMMRYPEEWSIDD